MTTALAEKIKTWIRASGPITVMDYFALCLADPEFGYYQTRDPFGVAGDFVTAPEVSQLFGEMIGIYLVQAWQKHGKPDTVRLTEIGPGRGTMMRDMLRVIQKLAPALYEAATVHMVETSERLQRLQGQTLVEHKMKITWHTDFSDIPAGFMLSVANELFDAIPVRQYVKTPAGFCERLVALNETGELVFAIGTAAIDPKLLPMPEQGQPDGTIFETSAARLAVMELIGHRLFEGKGSALIIDYGHVSTRFGDTLQAVLKHRHDPPLAHPGEADLTSHVDFEELANIARYCGIHVNGLMYQGDFLVGLGLLERAAALGRDKDALTQDAIRIAVERLAGSGAGNMGELFKVLAISSPRIDLSPFRKID